MLDVSRKSDRHIGGYTVIDKLGFIAGGDVDLAVTLGKVFFGG
jgi:hypothetical protein